MNNKQVWHDLWRQDYPQILDLEFPSNCLLESTHWVGNLDKQLCAIFSVSGVIWNEISCTQLGHPIETQMGYIWAGDVGLVHSSGASACRSLYYLMPPAWLRDASWNFILKPDSTILILLTSSEDKEEDCCFTFLLDHLCYLFKCESVMNRCHFTISLLYVMHEP